MALFTKLFSGLRTSQNRIHERQESSEKVCPFDVKQVRMVLFRECDFRGRKLLFDSDATQKVPLEKKGENESFVEITNGFGYLISKQNGDYAQLSEMIFGSVAMSYRGTYFKIHNLPEPFRLMFTQVFPSPHSSRRRISSSSHHSCLSTRSFDQSLRMDDSGASSTYSSEQHMSDRSTRSTASDTVLVWKRLRNAPRDLPRSAGILSKNSLVVDSGCGENHSSFSSISTGPLRFDTWESVVSYRGISATSLSSFTHLKHLLRSSSRSLYSSSGSLSNSTEDVVPRGHHRSSMLGLAVMIDIPQDKQEFLTQFMMEHIALLESMLCRARLAIESAYHRPPSFISAMFQLSTSTAQWLVSLINGPRLFGNLWHCLCLKTCDNFTSINVRLGSSDILHRTSELLNGDNNKVLNRTKSCNFLQTSDNRSGLTSSLSFSRLQKPDFFSFRKFLKTDLTSNDSETKFRDELVVETFLKEFCELLETVDVKDTNFFISTLLTAVLTHHLGWVATCFPASPGTSTPFKDPYNPLWSQLTDLYGAVGHPAKTAQTILTGSNRSDVINKILNSLTYFIRFSNVDRKNITRGEMMEENKEAEMILTQHNCIPKDSYKKYEDHVRELLVSNDSEHKNNLEMENNEMESKWNGSEHFSVPLEGKKNVVLAKGLSKVKTHHNLSDFYGKNTEKESYETQDDKNSSFRQLPSKNLSKDDETEFTNTNKDYGLMKRSKNLTKISTHTGNLTDLFDLERDHLSQHTTGLDVNENITEETNSNVIFVLGDNEKLVNLKKDQTSSEILNKFSVSKGVTLKRRNSFHNIYNNNSIKEDIEYSKLRKSSVCVLEKNKKEDTAMKTKKCLTKIPTSKSNLEFLKGKKLVDPFREECFHVRIKPSTSYESLCTTSKSDDLKLASKEEIDLKKFSRCQSEPPEDRSPTQPKFKYSRVKFNLQQYPQVVRNYMKGKNLELEGLAFEDKIGDKFCMIENNIKLDFSDYDSVEECCDVLQTPSNASELKDTFELGATTSYSDRLKKEGFPNIPEDAWEAKASETVKESNEFVLKSVKSSWILGKADTTSKHEEGSCSLEKYDSNNKQTHLTDDTKDVKPSIKSWILGAADSFEADSDCQKDLKSFSNEHLSNRKEVRKLNTAKMSLVLNLNDKIRMEDSKSSKVWILGESFEKDCSLTKNEDKVVVKPMKYVELPMPKTVTIDNQNSYSLLYPSTVIRGLVDTYIPDMVLQGTTSPERLWNSSLKHNLATNAQHSLLDHPIEESLAILANTDTWEVQVISSHTYVIDKNASGVRVGMSQLVSNMLESLLQMWKSRIPPKYCLNHIEQKLQELCVLSKALAELLLASEFCSMELLTSTLHLEVNDVPLLMAVASTHTPQVTEKYGLSFQ